MRQHSRLAMTMQNNNNREISPVAEDLNDGCMHDICTIIPFHIMTSNFL